MILPYRDAFYLLILAVLVVRELNRYIFSDGPVLINNSQSAEIPWRQDNQNVSSTSRGLPTVQETKLSNKTSSFLVDLVCIGSHTRPDYLKAQRETFATHTSVRNFFAVTEDDDAEPHCAATLTQNNMWYNVSDRCVQNSEAPYLLKRMQSFYWGPKELSGRPNPAGWLCAQKRPIHGFVKAVKSYIIKQEPFPNYLILLDDDSYINLETFEQRMSDKDADIPMMYGGDVSILRITRHPPVKERLFFAFGGFGLMLSRGALKNIVRPIHCQPNPPEDGSNRTEADRVACERVMENNLGEQEVFQEGMSLLDLMEAYVNYQKFVNYQNWTIGYCLHSDWTTAYFLTYYEISLHATNTIYYDDYRHARIQKLDFMEEQKYNPVCKENETCCNQAPICHYQTPDDLKRWTAHSRAQVPHKYKDLHRSEAQ